MTVGLTTHTTSDILQYLEMYRDNLIEYRRSRYMPPPELEGKPAELEAFYQETTDARLNELIQVLEEAVTEA